MRRKKTLGLRNLVILSDILVSLCNKGNICEIRNLEGEINFHY